VNDEFGIFRNRRAQSRRVERAIGERGQIFIRQRDLHTDAFADWRQQLNFVVLGERIRFERGAQRRRGRRNVENQPLALVRAERHERTLHGVGTGLHQKFCRVRGGGKICDFQQAAVLLTERGARGVDDGEIIQRQTERMPFESLAGNFFIGRFVVGQDENVRLLFAEFGGERDGGINRRVGRPAFPLRQQFVHVAPAFHGRAERTRLGSGENQARGRRRLAAKKFFQKIMRAGLRGNSIAHCEQGK
jgi:hypothetical protein